MSYVIRICFIFWNQHLQFLETCFRWTHNLNEHCAVPSSLELYEYCRTAAIMRHSLYSSSCPFHICYPNTDLGCEDPTNNMSWSLVPGSYWSLGKAPLENNWNQVSSAKQTEIKKSDSKSSLPITLSWSFQLWTIVIPMRFCLVLSDGMNRANIFILLVRIVFCEHDPFFQKRGQVD